MTHELNSYTTVETGRVNSVLVTQQCKRLNAVTGEYEPAVGYITFKGEEFMAMVRKIAEMVPVGSPG